MKQDKEWIKALRWLAEYFAPLKLLDLRDKDWDKLKLDMHEVLLPGTTNAPGSNYDIAFQRPDVGEAQRNVCGVLESIATRNGQVLKNDPNEAPNNLQQKIYPLRMPDAHRDVVIDGKVLKWVKPTQLSIVIEPDAKVRTFYESIDLPTMVYLTLRDALMHSGATDWILICDNRDCQKLFLSKRKPRQDRSGHYCSYRCCHLESTRRYREEGQKSEPFKAVERERVKAYYKPKKKGKARRGKL